MDPCNTAREMKLPLGPLDADERDDYR
jgi:hypothetical protein